MGRVATSPLPPRGSPPLQSGGQNQKWPINGQGGYVTPAASGIPTAAERGAKSEVAHEWARWLRQPLPPRGSPPLQSRGQSQLWPINGQGGYVTPTASGIPSASKRGAKSEVAHKWARWLATSPLPPLGSPSLQSVGQNQKWPINGQGGYVTPAASGIASASKRGAKSEVAHKWARWLRHPCRLGDPLRFKAGGKIRSGP